MYKYKSQIFYYKYHVFLNLINVYYVHELLIAYVLIVSMVVEINLKYQNRLKKNTP